MSTKYLTRVELNNVGSGDTRQLYTTLHSHMEAQGFRRTVKADDGRIYQMPAGTYLIETHAGVEQVRDTAHAAVARTGRTAEIFTCERGGSAWVGLDLAR